MVEIDDDEPTGETEDESVAVTTEPDQGWRTADGFVAYDNYHQAFVHEDGKPRVIIIINNHERHSGVPFPNNKHYFVVVPDWEFWRITPLCIELSELKITNDGSYELFIESLSTATLWPPINSVLLDDNWYGVPLYVPDPNVDHARPVTEVTKTTSAVTGNTVETTVVTDPKAVGPVTSSEVKVGIADQVNNLKVGDTATPEQIRFMAQGAKPDTKAKLKLEPCIPNVPPANEVAKGAGSAPKVKGPDDVIAEARKRAAERANVNPNVSDGTANPGPAAEATKPQLVTQDTTVNPVNGKPSSEASVTEGVYAYKPMRTGFDRYDFNSGKKLFTAP